MTSRPWLLIVALTFGLASCDEDTSPQTVRDRQSTNPASTPPEAHAPTKSDDARSNNRPQARSQTREDDLTYPRDREKVMATVHGRKITLGDIIEHLDVKHFRGFANFVAQKVGQFEIRNPRMADWTRQYADVVALRAETSKRGIPEAAILKEMGAVYEETFAEFKKLYKKQLNRPFPTSLASVTALRNDFQKKRGLGMEVEGLLNALVPDELNQIEADNFLKAYNQEVNGLITVAQIYIRNRNTRTGALYGPDKMKKVREKIREIEKRLKPDGSNFEDVAVQFSEHPGSAREGGRLENLLRYDPRMPAQFCRAAWGLRNGEWTGPIQTRFGTHFVKRVKWTIRRTVLRVDPTNKDWRRLVRTHRKEELLFKIRKESAIELFY